MALERAEVFLEVFVVIVEDGEHKRRGKRLFDVDCANFVCLAFNASCSVYYLHVVARQRFAGRARFFRKSLETQIVRENGSSSLSLPVAIIDQFSLEVFLDPLEGWNITTLAHQSHALQAFNVMLADQFSIRVLFPDCSDRSWRGIKMLD